MIEASEILRKVRSAYDATLTRTVRELLPLKPTLRHHRHPPRGVAAQTDVVCNNGTAYRVRCVAEEPDGGLVYRIEATPLSAAPR